jgi:hypothetical protein
MQIVDVNQLGDRAKLALKEVSSLTHELFPELWERGPVCLSGGNPFQFGATSVLVLQFY